MKPELRELQKAIVEERARRGFTTEPLQVFTLLQEEVGEIAGELKKTWSPNYDTFGAEALGEEIADCLTLLLALADHYSIDAAQAIDKNFIDKDRQRTWQRTPKNDI
jgi:NTP pyrophosphatase (non-canonical NTP hydrolase)